MKEIKFGKVKSPMDNIEEYLLSEKEEKELPDHSQSIRAVLNFHLQVDPNHSIHK